ncbi:DUF1992 domain-containing protein [Nocardioides caldifontis]|uniref:DnaJ family domain-containing protein n=1 Tax=Nocardioides caldifontis TaxID=2588938 RepID=UPI001EEF8BA6|nr:DUF1992 domain-containing protein [Nocardioides caldifontis]
MDDETEREQRPEERRAAAAARIAQQQTWVDLQLRKARERGDFDDLPGYGKPITGLGDEHDPDWWVKQLLEREQVTGVAPPSVQLRREDADLDERLDRLGSEADVRREVTEFNARVRWALYRPPEGPPVVTPQRDPDTEVERWRDRRAARVAARREAAAARAAEERPRRGRDRGRERGRARWRDRLGGRRTDRG